MRSGVTAWTIAGWILMGFGVLVFLPVWLGSLLLALVLTRQLLHTDALQHLWPAFVLAVLLDLTTATPGPVTISLSVTMLVTIALRHLLSHDTWLSHLMVAVGAGATAILCWPLCTALAHDLWLSASSPLVSWYSYRYLGLASTSALALMVVATMTSFISRRFARV